MKLSSTNRFITWLLIFAFTLIQISPAWANAPASGSNGNNPQNPNGGSKDPIDTKTGNNYFTERDFEFSTPGVPVELFRKYNSEQVYDSPFGKGWSLSMDWRLHQAREIITEVVPPVTNQHFKVNLWEGTQLLCSGNVCRTNVITVQTNNQPAVTYTNIACLTNVLTVIPTFFYGSPVGELKVAHVAQPGNLYYVNLNQAPVSGTIGFANPVPISSLKDTDGNLLPMDGITYETNQWLEVYQGDGTTTRFWDTNTNGVYTADEKNWSMTFTNDLWTLHLPGGEQRLFTPEGRMVRHQDGWGKGISFGYTDGKLTSATHDNGFTVTFNYIDGRISAVNAGADMGVSYSYTNGLLASITQQYGAQQRTRQYEYVDGFLTKRVNSEGHEYNYGYETNALGRLTAKANSMSVEEERWYAHQVQYRSPTLTDVIYANSGKQQIHRYAYSSKTKKLTENFGPGTNTVDVEARGIRYAYNTALDEIEETRFDNNTGSFISTFTAYDRRHNPTNVSVAYCTTSPVPLVSMIWNQTLMRPSLVMNAEGEKMTMSYTNGSLSRLREFYTESNSYSTAFGHTTNGLLSAITNANSHVTRYTYDSRGYPETVTPAAGPRVSTVYDNYGHIQTSEVLPEGAGAGTGRITQFNINPLGWLESVTYADGLSLSNQYNKLGDLTNVVDRAGRITAFTYTPESRLASKTQYLEQNGSNVPVRIAYDYDQQLNALRITEPRGRYVESYALDIQDRITTVTNIDGQTMTFGYSVGNMITNISRFDKSVASIAYDSAGRKKESSIMMPTVPIYQAKFTVSVPLDTYPGVSHPGDKWGVVISGGVTNYTYFEFLRDEPLSPVPAGYGSQIQYSYYPDSQLKTISDGTTSISNSYDRLNRLTNTVTTIGNRQSAIANAFDPVGNVTNSVVSIGGQQPAVVNGYTYDQAERLKGIFTTEGAETQSFVYDYSPVNGRVSSVTNSESGIVTAYGYDILDRVTNISYRTASGSLIRSLFYQYDALGMITNVITRNDSSQLSVKSYQYDTINRLTAEESNVQGLTSKVDYRYDLAGNRSSVIISNNQTQTTNTYTLGIGDRLSSVDATPPSRSLSFGYDIAGNTTNITTGTNVLSLGWNAKYELTSVTSATSAVEYSYDVLGRRASRTCHSSLATNEECFVYSGNQVVADLDASGNILRTYTWGPGIDNLLSMTIHNTSDLTPKTYYPLKDHLNSVLAFTDASGSIVESYEYDAYGKVLDVKDASGNSIANHQSSIGNRYLWQGREYDFQTGLYYFRARWYSPEIGRWLSKDPIGISGGLNLYAAFGNNPVNFVDPLGESISGNYYGAGGGYYDPGYVNSGSGAGGSGSGGGGSPVGNTNNGNFGYGGPNSGYYGPNGGGYGGGPGSPDPTPGGFTPTGWDINQVSDILNDLGLGGAGGGLALGSALSLLGELGGAIGLGLMGLGVTWSFSE